MSDLKDHLHRYLRNAREAIVWKVDGLDEYDQRRPLVPTGTNLLGLAKHLAAMETLYFTVTFDRPVPDELAWTLSDPVRNEDMYASARESPEQVLGWYRRACEVADATIGALGPDAPGRVPWWSPAHADTTLAQVMLHMVAETNRHAGHADIVRELVDGSAGLNPRFSNLPELDADGWTEHYGHVQAIAEGARARRTFG